MALSQGWHIFRAEFRRGIQTPYFLTQILLMLLCMGMNILVDLMGDFSYCWQMLLSSACTRIEYFAELFLIIGAVSFAWSYNEDRATGFLRPILQRVDVWLYCWAKFLTVAILSFLASTIALILFALLVQLLPLVPPDTTWMREAGSNYLSFVGQGQSLSFFLARCLITGLTCSLSAVVSLAVSAWVDNLFVILMAPFLMFHIWERLIELLQVWKLSCYPLLFGQILEDPGASVLRASLILLTAIVIVGESFVFRAGKETP